VYTAKPVIYGLIAARVAGVPFRAAMITGLGSALAGGPTRRQSALSHLLRGMYSIALRHAHVVFFQNPDDEQLFRRLRLVRSGQTIVRINGSGVDLAHYAVAPLPPGRITFLMICRLLRDKGVMEYVEAAKLVRGLRNDCRFQLLGPLDTNPTAITRDQLDAWIAEGAIEYLGDTADVRPFLADAHVCVLPSYGEGMPRSVLEAMSMGRAIVTTDVPGCRETVVPGVNGWLVAPRQVDGLASAMLRILEEPGDIERMGAASRQIAEQRFDVHAVNRVILDAMGLELG
jgi:glycosyltransferase involved in cell wall biosynthesis